MAHYDFHSDLAVAEKTEREIGEYLESKHNVKVLEYNNDNRYDLLIEVGMGSEQFRIEIKEDFMAHSTGNIAIEYHSRGKPSGIAVTQADLYIYKVVKPDGSYELLSAKVDDIKQAIKESKYFRIVNGGDAGSNTKMFLFRKEVYMRFATRL